MLLGFDAVVVVAVVAVNGGVAVAVAVAVHDHVIVDVYVIVIVIVDVNVIVNVIVNVDCQVGDSSDTMSRPAMTAESQAVRCAQLVDEHLASVWNFCARMTLSDEDATRAVVETFERAAHGRIPDETAERELWLLKIAAFVAEKKLPASPEVDFDLLDETLRSEATRTQEVGSLSQPEREYLLWELKQGCMTAVINCLSPGERVAFVLSAVMGKSDEAAASALGIKTSAFKVRLSRARKKIGDYLAPRCEHVDARNPCRCPSRIGIALRKGFIAPPQTAVVQLRSPARPFDQEIRSRDAVNIFRTLPEVEVPAELRAQVLDKIKALGTASSP